MTPVELVGSVAGVVAAVLTVGAAVGVLWARMRSSADETTAGLWRGEAEAQKARADRLEAALAALERRVDHLEAENKTLRALHDGRDEMRALRDEMRRGFATIGDALAMKDGNGVDA